MSKGGARRVQEADGLCESVRIKFVAGVRYATLLPEIRPHDTRQFASPRDFHQLEGLAVARPWGFESPLPHQPLSIKKPETYQGDQASVVEHRVQEHELGERYRDAARRLAGTAGLARPSFQIGVRTLPVDRQIRDNKARKRHPRLLRLGYAGSARSCGRVGREVPSEAKADHATSDVDRGVPD